MEKIFPRSNAKLDVKLSLPRQGQIPRAETRGLGPGGLFVKEDLPKEDAHQYVLDQLDQGTDRFLGELGQIEARIERTGLIDESDFEELNRIVDRLFDVFRGVDKALADQREILTERRVQFRNRTHDFFSKGYLHNRARVWPQGYPGDYSIIESIYRNIPLSSGLGFLLDRHFLNATLAHAVRHRKNMMKTILSEELRARRQPRVMNIGCGPCRELLELAWDIRESGAKVTCLDLDSEALSYSEDRLANTLAQSCFDFRKYNVLRMVSPSRNRERFGSQDVIYSMGLFDYLDDETIIRLTGALYELLNPGGKLILAFKDADRYETFDYHWLADWDYFKQRSLYDSRILVDRAGIPAEHVDVRAIDSGVIVFYSLTR